TSSDAGTGNYNQFWIADRDFDNRTSLITDPPDGRIPSLTAEAKKRVPAENVRGFDGPESRSLSERCITYGAPRIQAAYNSYYQITLNDPTTWVMPWTLMIPLKKTNEEIYEYACHESKEAMVGILSGARAKEKEAPKK